MVVPDLNGLRVLVTRPAAQADDLCRRIESAGGRPVRLPVIEIAGHEPDASVLARLPTADLAIFVSANAVERGLRWIREHLGGWPDGLPIAAIGRQTAGSLADAGLPVAFFPERGGDSEALLAMPEMRLAPGRRVVVVRGVGGRELIARSLRAREVEVEYLEVYRRRPVPGAADGLAALARRRAVDVVTVTSNAILERLDALAGEADCRAWLHERPLVVMGRRGYALAGRLGFRRVWMTDGSGGPGIVSALGRYSTDTGSNEGGDRER